MEMRHFWWIHDFTKPEKMYGSLTESEVKELIREMREHG